MRFTELPIVGAYRIDLDPHHDDRGSFCRVYCVDELAGVGIRFQAVQSSTSLTRIRGTIRGLHYQRSPYEEAKIVRCTRGSIYDVVLDLRRESPTYRRWSAIELRSETPVAAYIPQGCAHGLQTLEAMSEVTYLMDQRFMPEFAAGVRWNDPLFAVRWPLPEPVLSDRDRSFPDYREEG